MFVFSSYGEVYGIAVPVLGLTVGMLLYRRNPRRFNFLQETCSLEMWGSGSHQKVHIYIILVFVKRDGG